MPRSVVPQISDFAPMALAASRVGTWQRAADTGLVRCDPLMAEIWGFDQDEADAGLTLDRFRARMLPEDRPVFDRKNAAVESRGGLIVVEYRITPRPGAVRWILARGRYDAPREPARYATGRGIVIDITDSKLDGRVEEKAFFVHPDEHEVGVATDLRPIHHAADAALALHRHAVALGDEAPGLRSAAELALAIVARHLKHDA